MSNRISIALVLFTLPVLADTGLFHNIRNKDSVTLVLASGECDARVVGRKLDQLTLRLTKKTRVCGEREALIVVARTDVQDVVNNRSRTVHALRESRAGFCAAAAMALVGAPGAYAIGESTGNGSAALLVLFGSGVGGAVLCRQRGSRYTVFADRITPLQP